MSERPEMLLTERVESKPLRPLERAYVGSSIVLNGGSAGLAGMVAVRGIETGNFPLSAVGICVALLNGRMLYDIAEYFEEKYPDRDPE